ncbi:hypothetical protein [Pedobacter sp. NJ-S-72]
MKHLFIAIICTVIGFSASASDLTLKKNSPLVNEVEIKIISKESKNEVTIPTTKNTSETGFFRISRSFLFEDACGEMWIIYVSGPNNVSRSIMYVRDVARNAFAHGSGSNGCFNGL